MRRFAPVLVALLLLLTWDLPSAAAAPGATRSPLSTCAAPRSPKLVGLLQDKASGKGGRVLVPAGMKVDPAPPLDLESCAASSGPCSAD